MSDGQMSYNHEVLRGMGGGSTTWESGVDNGVLVYFAAFSVL